MKKGKELIIEGIKTINLEMINELKSLRLLALMERASKTDDHIQNIIKKLEEQL